MAEHWAITLRYGLRTDGSVVFRDAAPVKKDFDGFAVTLENDQARVNLAEPLEISSARSYVEPHLERWALIEGEGRIRFNFEGVVTVDPADPDKKYGTVVAGAGAAIAHFETEYPPPPMDPFAVSPSVEAILYLYRRYVDGAKNISELGYHCLTELEKQFGGRDAAARQCRISGHVLGRLGELTSEVGDARTGRKVGRERRPHKPRETRWIEQAVRLIIRRLGEYEHDPEAEHPQVTMADLPEL